MTTLRSLVPPHDLDTLCDLAASTPPGAFVELGVYQGGSAQRLYKIAERQGRTLHLFDTFDGHKQSGEFDHANHPNGRFADAIDPDELQRQLPGAVINRGTFPKNFHPALLAFGAPFHGVAFLHSDLDLYEPTRAVCEIFPQLMVSGGIILFDDYFHDDCPGVKKAVDEAFPNAETYNGRRIVRIP